MDDDDCQTTCTCTFPSTPPPTGACPPATFTVSTTPPPTGACPPTTFTFPATPPPTVVCPPATCTCNFPTTPPPTGACSPATYTGTPARGFPGMETQSIHNPPVPFVTPISGGILPGKKIFISGVLNPNAQRFTVNLICGPHDGGGDIAFHFDVRIRVGGQRDVIVRNSCQGGGWGAEERHSPCFPFVPNAKFDIKIKTKPGKFKIAVNKQHLLEFRHRMKPLDRINTLQILGDLRLTEVRL